MFAYIDESGDSGFSKKSSKNFIVTAVVVQNENVLERIAKNVFRKHKLGKLNKNQLHSASDPDRVKLTIVNLINKIDYTIIYNVKMKTRIGKDYYTESLKNLKLESSPDLEKVFLSRKETTKKSEKEISKIFKTKKLGVIITTPQKEKGLQIADFVSWAIYQKYENGNDEYYNLLKTTKPH